MIIISILNLLIVLVHLFIIFSPIALFFIKIPKRILKYLLLVPVLVVYHWGWLKNQCALTILQKKFGLSKLEGESGFSEKYLKWLYDPIMKIFNMKWNDENLDIIINFHWLINFLIIWYFTFF